MKMKLVYLEALEPRFNERTIGILFSRTSTAINRDRVSDYFVEVIHKNAFNFSKVIPYNLIGCIFGELSS